MRPQIWDAIVIGSGMGGLGVAALLAKFKNQKVLVLEAHDKLGGFTHTFSRRQHVFDVGVHYVGGLANDPTLKSVFSWISEDRIQWDPLNYEFDQLLFGGDAFSIPADPQEYIRRLRDRFPAEEAAIRRYFRDVPVLANSYALWQLLELFPKWLGKSVEFFLRWRRPALFRRTEEELNRRFAAPELKTILTAPWGGYGVPPEKSSFGFHCVHAHHYAYGGWYPHGGGEALAAQISPTFLARGGELRTGCRVEEILVEKGVAKGVRLATGETLLARQVVSDAGVVATYQHLLPEPWRKKMSLDTPVPSMFVIYAGLKTSPKAMGFQDTNYWILEDDKNPLFLSFPSLKRKSEKHTAEIMHLATEAEFSKWKESAWKNRGVDYETYKAELMEMALEKVERRFPGFRDSIQFVEASTPLSVNHFQAKYDGGVYGLPATPERLWNPLARTTTAIEGLYLTGCDCFTSGVGGAAFSGFKTFMAITKPRSLKNSIQILRDLS